MTWLNEQQSNLKQWKTMYNTWWKYGIYVCLMHLFEERYIIYWLSLFPVSHFAFINTPTFPPQPSFKILSYFGLFDQKQLDGNPPTSLLEYLDVVIFTLIKHLNNICGPAWILKAATTTASPCPSSLSVTHNTHSTTAILTHTHTHTNTHCPPPRSLSAPLADWPMQTLSSSSSAEALRKYPSLQCWQFWPLVLCLQLTHVTMFR